MKNKSFIRKLKRFYWGLKPELNEWHQSFLFSIPGATGEFLRRRYAHKHFKDCGSDLRIGHHVKIYGQHEFKVGNSSIISEFVQITAGGGVTIGDRVILGPFVKIWSINHKFNRIDIPIWEQGWTLNPVIIEDDVWIGMGAILLPGTHIGNGSIISAGTVLRKTSIEPYTIVAGNPGKVVGHRRKDS